MFSDGWLSNRKERNGICRFRLHGEAGSAAQEEEAEHTMHLIQQILMEYQQEAVCNMDATALYLRGAQIGHWLFQEPRNGYVESSFVCVVTRMVRTICLCR